MRVSLGVRIAIGLTLSVGTARASDVPPWMPAYKLASPVEYIWTDFYVGANAGYGFANGSMVGIIGGGQVGYNWHAGNWLFGLETDLQASGKKASPPATTLGVTISETDKLNWFGTTRLRSGFAGDRWLIYATGGIAYGRIKENGTASGLVVGAYSGSNTLTGWTVGGGIEVAIGTRSSWKVEYLYVTLPSFTNTYTLPGAGLTINYPRTNDNIVRVGINYRLAP